jgi:hypothetical protein
MELRKVVKAGKQDAKESVKQLFDWLEGLEPQATMKGPPMTGPAAKEAKIPTVSFSSCLNRAQLLCSLDDVDVFSRFQKKNSV